VIETFRELHLVIVDRVDFSLEVTSLVHVEAHRFSYCLQKLVRLLLCVGAEDEAIASFEDLFLHSTRVSCVTHVLQGDAGQVAFLDFVQLFEQGGGFLLHVVQS
jgi:hypothetical protein